MQEKLDPLASNKNNFHKRFMTLKDFIINFVGHNSEVILFDEAKDMENRKLSIQQREKWYKLEKVWSGMEWQITDTEESYFEAHLDVAPCPYLNSRVARVFSCDTDTVPILGIEIDIDWDDYKLQLEERKKFLECNRERK